MLHLSLAAKVLQEVGKAEAGVDEAHREVSSRSRRSQLQQVQASARSSCG